MLIPEQAKSPWQPIKSRKQSSSFSVTLWDILVSVCIDPILQMRHSRNSSTLPESSLICHWHWNQLRVCRQGNSLCGFVGVLWVNRVGWSQRHITHSLWSALAVMRMDPHHRSSRLNYRQAQSATAAILFHDLILAVPSAQRAVLIRCGDPTTCDQVYLK